MEEQILEMIRKYDIPYYTVTAKEITTHMTEFIDFLLTGCDGVFIQHHKENGIIYFDFYDNDNFYSLNEVYEYWNLQHKKQKSYGIK